MSMKVAQKTLDYATSAEGLAIRRELEVIVADRQFNTQASYTTNSDLYPDNLIPFVDKHMDYIACHTSLDAALYLDNLRLMTRIRG